MNGTMINMTSQEARNLGSIEWKMSLPPPKASRAPRPVLRQSWRFAQLFDAKSLVEPRLGKPISDDILVGMRVI
jgi:hypothetical protein